MQQCRYVYIPTQIILYVHRANSIKMWAFNVSVDWNTQYKKNRIFFLNKSNKKKIATSKFRS